MMEIDKEMKIDDRDLMTLWLNSDPICPWCGHKQQDAWEYGLDDGEDMDIECDACEREFTVECSLDIRYTTYRKTTQEAKK